MPVSQEVEKISAPSYNTLTKKKRAGTAEITTTLLRTKGMYESSWGKRLGRGSDMILQRVERQGNKFVRATAVSWSKILLWE